MESTLYKALKAFPGANGNEANLPAEFEKIAEAAFFSGYFLVNGGTEDEYRLKLTCIEFYYHEDEGNIKDPKKYLKGKDEFGYALGAVCPNPSGVDVLFDDPDKKYHASFLIRGYKAIQKGKPDWENNVKKPDWAPQDFWYDLFGGADMLRTGRFSIEWVDEPEETTDSLEPMERIGLHDERMWGYKRIRATDKTFVNGIHPMKDRIDSNR